jgi:Tol biopolymer transport system component
LVENGPQLVLDPVFSPDGQALYFSALVASGGALLRVPIPPKGRAQGEKPEMIKTTGEILYRHLNFSADGRSLAYSAMSAASNIWSVRYTPGRKEALGPPEPLTHDTTLRKFSPLFSPDGKRIVYTVGQTGRGFLIWVMDADGKNAKPLTATMSWDANWFPGGQRVALVDDRKGKPFLESLDTESGRKKSLREMAEDWAVVRLSPDGKQIAFNSRQGGAINVWTAPVEGGPARQLTFDKELMGFPCWSPDGKFIAFEMRRGDDTHVAIIPSEGGTPLQLTSEHGQSWVSDWSPDGDKIVFAGLRNSVWNIWWVSRRDETEKQITHYTKMNSYVRYPAWSPRGNQISYEYTETTGNVWVMRMK